MWTRDNGRGKSSWHGKEQNKKKPFGIVASKLRLRKYATKISKQQQCWTEAYIENSDRQIQKRTEHTGAAHSLVRRKEMIFIHDSIRPFPERFGKIQFSPSQHFVSYTIRENWLPRTSHRRYGDLFVFSCQCQHSTCFISTKIPDTFFLCSIVVDEMRNFSVSSSDGIILFRCRRTEGSHE